jgi:hypothetical protein
MVPVGVRTRFANRSWFVRNPGRTQCAALRLRTDGRSDPVSGGRRGRSRNERRFVKRRVQRARRVRLYRDHPGRARPRRNAATSGRGMTRPRASGPPASPSGLDKPVRNFAEVQLICAPVGLSDAIPEAAPNDGSSVGLFRDREVPNSAPKCSFHESPNAMIQPWPIRGRPGLGECNRLRPRVLASLRGPALTANRCRVNRRSFRSRRSWSTASDSQRLLAAANGASC